MIAPELRPARMITQAKQRVQGTLLNDRGGESQHEGVDFESALTSTPHISLHRTKRRGEPGTEVNRVDTLNNGGEDFTLGAAPIGSTSNAKWSLQVVKAGNANHELGRTPC
jgi:hypothetical protein